MSKKYKRFCTTVSTIFIVCIINAAMAFAFYTRNEYLEIYNEGVALLENGSVTEAVDIFREIPNYTQYRDIAELLEEYGFSVCPHCGSLLE